MSVGGHSNLLATIQIPEIETKRYRLRGKETLALRLSDNIKSTRPVMIILPLTELHFESMSKLRLNALCRTISINILHVV